MPPRAGEVHWGAVFLGWLLDFVLRLLLQVAVAWLGLSAFYYAPSVAQPAHLALFALLLLSAGTGGFVGARLAGGRFALHGLLVGVTGILAAAVANPGVLVVPRLFVLAQLLSVAAGIAGGLLARLFAPRLP